MASQKLDKKKVGKIENNKKKAKGCLAKLAKNPLLHMSFKMNVKSVNLQISIMVDILAFRHAMH